MKIPYYAFITALHAKLSFWEYFDSDKIKKYTKVFCNEDRLFQYLHKFSPNPNVSYNTDPDMPRKVVLESCFIPKLMKIGLSEYIQVIRDKCILNTGFIYVVKNHNMVPSHRYPKMEVHCFDDMPFLARIPISRELDWKYETNIQVQEIRLSGLQITS